MGLVAWDVRFRPHSGRSQTVGGTAASRQFQTSVTLSLLDSLRTRAYKCFHRRQIATSADG